MKRKWIMAIAGALLLIAGFAAYRQVTAEMPFSLTFLHYTNEVVGSREKANPPPSNANKNLAVFQLLNKTTHNYFCKDGVIVFKRPSGWEENTNPYSKYEGGSAEISGNAVKTITIEVPAGTNAWRFNVYLNESFRHIGPWRSALRRAFHGSGIEQEWGETIILTSPDMRR